MKKLFFSIVLMMLMMFVVACGGSGGQETATGGDSGSGTSQEADKPTYKFKIGYNTNEESIRAVYADVFADYVTEKTEGRVTFDMFPNEILGSEQDMVDQVQMGELEFQVAGGGMMSNAIPEFAIMSLPFLVESFDELHAVLDGPLGEEWKELGEQHGFKVLGYGDLGFAHVTNSVRPINSPGDMQGLTMRAPNGPQYILPFAELGSSVSTMPFQEVYLALNQGVVDGQFNPLDAIYQTNFHEVQDYLAMTYMYNFHTKLIMNKDLYDRLDEELQQIIQEAAEVGAAATREYALEMENDMLSIIEPHFTEITYPDLEPFREAVAPAYDEFRELFGEDVDRTLQFIEEYRANN